MTGARVGRRMLTLATLTAAALTVTTLGVHAFNPQPEPPARWVVGLTDDQRASLTVVNLAERGECPVAYTWLDADGELLFRSTAVVAAGTFDSNDFVPPEPVQPRSGDDHPADDGRTERFRVRPAVIPLEPGSGCELSTTLEIVNNADGKTTAIIGNTDR